MDPMTSLSLCANLIEVLNFSIKLVTKGVHIYKAADGALAENYDTEVLAIDLQNSNATLTQYLYGSETKSKSIISASSTITLVESSPALVPSDPDENDQELIDLCEACNKIAQELVAKLSRLKVQPGTRHREWKSARQALKSVWSKGEIDAVAARLKQYRDQLNTRILVSLRFVDLIATLPPRRSPSEAFLTKH
jgi:hypothetical protein